MIYISISMNKLETKYKYRSGKYKKHWRGKHYEYESFSPSKINQPYYWEDDRIPMLLEQTNRLLGELNAYSRLVPDVDFFIQMHVMNEAVKSSRIEGTRTEIDEAVLPEEEIAPHKKDDWTEVRNYIKAMNYSIEQLENLPVSMRLLKKAHEILITNTRGEDKLPGQIRVSQNWIGGATIESASFIPPHQNELPELLSDLEKFWHNKSINIPVLIKVAMNHYQFETIHPFLDGNGRIGRLMITLQLIERGFLNRPTLYLSDFFEKHKGDYYDSLTIVREKNDMDQWIVFFLSGIIDTATKSRERFEKIVDLRTKYEQRIMELGRRAKTGQKMLLYLFSNPAIQAKEAASYLDVAYNTANDLISQFQNLGILKEVTGYSRNRVFIMQEYLELFKK